MQRLLTETHRVIEQGIADQLHVGAQVYISLAGGVVADLAIGEARDGVAMTPDTLMLWLSSTKPIGAVALLQLIERGQLALDDPVCRYVSEFGTRGKEAITVRHLLTHTGGFRWIDTGWPDTTWDEIIARICAAKVERDWKPGEKAGYHMFTSWYILGELVRRIDTRPFSQYVRDEMFTPLGMLDSWVGMSSEQFATYGMRIGQLADTEKPRAGKVWPVHRYSSRAGAIDCIPGGNGLGPMRELGWFYEALQAGGQRNGARILQRGTVEAMTSRQREGMFDETFKHTIDWGWGVIINSNRYGVDTVPYGYGRYASEATFGHSGSQSSVGFCDPQHRLVVAAVLNGTPGPVRHDRRMRALCEAIYRDLELV